ncbi:MAG: DUF1501 domain-containing protein [Bdellovibrionales bacterium]|nr:DUF1501 domain-containing protein [Bdellovibrionales bacterium]
MNRREFLLSSSGLVLGSTFLNSAFAVPNTSPSGRPHFFVLLRMTDGWDVTLSLDPKVHGSNLDQQDVFLEYRPEEIFRFETLALGPSAEPLKPFAKELLVLNGVLMNSSDNGHGASLNFITTGNGEGKAPTLPIEIAASMQRGPLGIITNTDAVTLDRPVMVTSSRSLLDFENMVQLAAFEGFLKSSKSDSDFMRAIEAIVDNKPVMDRLIAELKATKSAREAAGDQEGVMEACALIAAFNSQVAFQGQIDLTQGRLDTHDDHEGKHLEVQKGRWTSVAEIFKLFKNTPLRGYDESLFDHTTFMVVSEFARTPALNNSKGKDHNPYTNSVLLAGGLVNGGRSVGASQILSRNATRSGTPKHTALPLDFKTGEIGSSFEIAKKDNFNFLTPDRVVASVAKGMGVDANRFRSASLAAPTLSGLFKS